MNRGLKRLWDNVGKCLHSLTILTNPFRMNLKKGLLKSIRVSYLLVKSLTTGQRFTINPLPISKFSQLNSLHWDKPLTRQCRPKTTSLISKLVAAWPRIEWTWNSRSREVFFRAVTKSKLSWIKEKLNSKRWRTHYWPRSMRNNKRKNLKNRDRPRKKLVRRSDSELNTKKVSIWMVCPPTRQVTLAVQLVFQPLQASLTWPCTTTITSSVLLAHILAAVSHSTKLTQKEVSVKWLTRPLNKVQPNSSNKIRLRHLKNHFKLMYNSQDHNLNIITSRTSLRGLKVKLTLLRWVNFPIWWKLCCENSTSSNSSFNSKMTKFNRSKGDQTPQNLWKVSKSVPGKC